MEYALSNDSISIKVSTAGGSFTSIEAGGREYLWQGRSRRVVRPGAGLLSDLRRPARW